MTGNRWTMLIKSDLRPAYYDDFHCLASDCRYTCCMGWSVAFDKADYLRLKQLKCSPKLDARLKESLRRIKKGPLEKKFYAEFDMTGGCCSLLREDRLCSLQLEQGHSTLPQVCKQFPRFHSYLPSGFLERSISPACEAVLELLWNLPDGIDFVSDPLPEREWRNAGFEYPIGLRAYFQDIRSQCIDFLQDRRYLLPQRILLMGLALKTLADGEQDIGRWLDQARALADNPATVGALPVPDAGAGLPLLLTDNLGMLQRMGAAQQTYGFSKAFSSIPDDLSAALEFQYQQGCSHATVSTVPYLEARARYEEQFAGREYFMENLMVALYFHTYMPELGSREEVWKSYVNFCNLYSFYRFLSVMSCREGVEDPRAELFRLILFASRNLLHNMTLETVLQDELFQHDSATLAHMAILLGG